MIRTATLTAAAAAGLVLLMSCKRLGEATGPTDLTETTGHWFTNIATDVGLNFTHHTGWQETYFYPEIMSSGCALFDYDGDGDLDAYLINGADHKGGNVNPSPIVCNRLFRQDSDGRFTDVTEFSGLGDAGYGMGCAIADLDGDDDLDVYVTNYGANKLYANNGDGTFADVTNSAGMIEAGEGAWSCSAAFVDYDGDGDPDLYTTNYLQYDPDLACRDRSGGRDYCGPMAFHGSADTLHRNNGDGTFTNVSAESGIGYVRGKGLGVVASDFNEDGLMDLYVANDGEANFLWINQGDGTFRDDALMYGVGLNAMGRAEASMGLALGDVDGDGIEDLFCTHLRDETNTLYRGEGARGFEDITGASGLGAASVEYTGFGTGFFDFDHDGDLDVFVVNGRVQRGAPLHDVTDDPLRHRYAEPARLYANDGQGRFSDVSDQAGDAFRQTHVGRGLAFGDIDRDGDLDVLVSNGGGPAMVYRNDAPKHGHWLMVKACEPNRELPILGAVITVAARGEAFRRTVRSSDSYLSANAMHAHFGLGDLERVDRITVAWPNGDTEDFDGSPVDRYIRLERGMGRSIQSDNDP